MELIHSSYRLTHAVHKLLAQSQQPALLTIEQCASSLAMSITSFRRKLVSEQTTYKLIQQKYLNELCVTKLVENQLKIDDIAIRLGYSERATFERAFRQKFGITPSKFRSLSLNNMAQQPQHNIADIAQSLPPISGSCRQLLNESNANSLDLSKTVYIVEQDPILSGRVLGLASRAIYGKTPRDITEAIGRNLGINTVVNLAITYAAKDALQEHVDEIIIKQYIQAFLIAPKFFQLVRKLTKNKIKFDVEQTEKAFVFALLGIFLLSHKQAYKQAFMLHAMQGVDDLHSLNRHVFDTVGISIYSASSLVLSLWHMDAGLIKILQHLDSVSRFSSKGTSQDNIVLFMLSCLYAFATDRDEMVALSQQAELIGICDFSAIKDLLASSK